jgi:F-type H+-transporting ATPase subunit a
MAEPSGIDPMHQFLVAPVSGLPRLWFVLPGVGGIDLSITNSILFLLVAASLITVFFLVSARRQIVPGRMQAVAEIFHDMVDGVLTGGIIGDRGRPFLPFVFTLFFLILMLNFLGLIPYAFSVTAQLAVTSALAVMTFAIVLIVAFARNGLGFFKLFWPSGVNPGMALFIGFFELISFLIRPFTLALRLFGNMMGGHVVVFMFASFVVGLAAVAAKGGLASLGLAGSALSLSIVVALMGLELVVAFLQAFVFAALSCVYLNEVVNLDHGH